RTVRTPDRPGRRRGPVRAAGRPRPTAEGGRLDAVVDLELAQHARDVDADGAFADEQRTGDATVRRAFAEQLEDVLLPVRQPETREPHHLLDRSARVEDEVGAAGELVDLRP